MCVCVCEIIKFATVGSHKKCANTKLTIIGKSADYCGLILNSLCAFIGCWRAENALHCRNFGNLLTSLLTLYNVLFSCH